MPVHTGWESQQHRQGGWPVGFPQPNTIHAQRWDIASGYFKFLISNYFIFLKNCFQHLGCVCSPDTQHWLHLQPRIQAAMTQGPQRFMCGHSRTGKSALDLTKLEHKFSPTQDTLQRARVPQRQTRSSFLSKEDFQKVPALHYTLVSRQVPRGSGWINPGNCFPLELKELMQDCLLLWSKYKICLKASNISALPESAKSNHQQVTRRQSPTVIIPAPSRQCHKRYTQNVPVLVACWASASKMCSLAMTPLLF